MYFINRDSLILNLYVHNKYTKRLHFLLGKIIRTYTIPIVFIRRNNY